MNNSQKQKLLEKKYLFRFKDNINYFPEGNIIDTEEPDFIISNIGIEITNLYEKQKNKNRPRQALESIQEKIIDKSEEIYNSYNSTPIIAGIIFNKLNHVKNKDINSIATKIAKAILINAKKNQAQHRIQHTYDSNDLLPNEVTSINLLKL